MHISFEVCSPNVKSLGGRVGMGDVFVEYQNRFQIDGEPAANDTGA